MPFGSRAARSRRIPIRVPHRLGRTEALKLRRAALLPPMNGVGFAKGGISQRDRMASSYRRLGARAPRTTTVPMGYGVLSSWGIVRTFQGLVHPRLVVREPIKEARVTFQGTLCERMGPTALCNIKHKVGVGPPTFPYLLIGREKSTSRTVDKFSRALSGTVTTCSAPASPTHSFRPASVRP